MSSMTKVLHVVFFINHIYCLLTVTLFGLLLYCNSTKVLLPGLGFSLLLLFLSMMKESCHGCCASCIAAVSQALGILPCRMELHRSSAHASPPNSPFGCLCKLTLSSAKCHLCVSSQEAGSLEGFLSSLQSVFSLAGVSTPPFSLPTSVLMSSLNSNLVLKCKNVLP